MVTFGNDIISQRKSQPRTMARRFGRKKGLKYFINNTYRYASAVVSYCDSYFIDFSFGDYLRCGAIAHLSPMMQSVVSFAKKGGKVLGVCNGFQILCESGLLPGALLPNGNQQFVCKNIHLKNNNGEVYKIPIAHGDGRYFANEETLDDLEKNKQVLYYYCDDKGNVDKSFNPNHAIRNIAGIQNKENNVFGMMPHPERASTSALGNTDGLKIFKELGLN